MTSPSTSTTPLLVCRSCQQWTQGAHVCSSCGKIQQLPRDTDYFAFFGMPRKLRMDAGELEKKFHQFSWKLHPDNFVNAGPEERELALQLSSQLNDAYRALREPISRVEYLLAIEGMRKEGQQKQQAPPELLEEVFDLNESLDELRETQAGEGDTTALRAHLAAAQRKFGGKLAEVDAQLDAVFGQWDAALENGADGAALKKIMSGMNELLNRRSYIRNLVASVQKEL